MNRVQFSIGQASIPDLEQRKNTAYAHLARVLGGFHAESMGFGGWLDANGLTVLEPDLIVTSVVPDDKLSLIDGTAEYLRKQFVQESVLVTVDYGVNARFVQTAR